MKLLFDQNLSPRLTGMLQDLYPESLHVRDVGLGDADDDVVWAYAKEHDFNIVTKDADFPRLSAIYGHPPQSDLGPPRQLPGVGGRITPAGTIRQSDILPSGRAQGIPRIDLTRRVSGISQHKREDRRNGGLFFCLRYPTLPYSTWYRSRCSLSTSDAKSFSIWRQTEWMWLAPFCRLSNSTTKSPPWRR